MPQLNKVCVPECFADGASTDELAAQIEQSLARVCDVVFHLGILRIPAPRGHQSHTQAHLRLAHASAAGFLSIDFSKDAAILLTRRFKIAVDTPEWDAFIQDTACEITNIVGNNVRSYFHSMGTARFGMGLALARAMPANVRPILKIEFLVGPTASLVVTFAIHEALSLTEPRAGTL